MNYPSPDESTAQLPVPSLDESTPLNINPVLASRSTLIEFPNKNRRSMPKWRRDLSDRVREIQERKARESAESCSTISEDGTLINAGALGVVPQRDPVEIHPWAIEALRRVERAHIQTPGAERHKQEPVRNTTPTARKNADRTGSKITPNRSSVTSQANLLSASEEAHSKTEDNLTSDVLNPVESAVISTLPPVEAMQVDVVASPLTIPAVEIQIDHPIVYEPVTVAPLAADLDPMPSIATSISIEVDETWSEIVEEQVRPAPRKAFEGVVDDSYLAKLEDRLLPPVASVEPLENHAPIGKRFAAGVLDLFFVAFASSPFAAIIELTNGNWTDPRVQIAMGGIVVLVLFLYETASLGLSGRTYGMSFFSLRVLDSRKGRHPSTLQCIWRAIAFTLVMATGFLPSVTSVFDPERRTVHDMLSRTVVVAD